MYTFTESQIALSESLAKVEQFIQSVSDHALHAKPTEKWSIAEELVHLTSADQGSAQAFSQSTITLRSTLHQPRNYNQIVKEYRENYAASDGVIPSRIVSNTQAQQMSGSDFLMYFSKAATALQQSLNPWTENYLDQVTVWKHPLLGPVTAREMLFFTIFHNRHHLASMHTKLINLENNIQK